METSFSTNIVGAGNVAPPAADTNISGTNASPLSSDFETFLKMLTVQMRNQDPLNPVDSSDFSVQLATFSSVEQQVRTNDLLVALNDSIGARNLGQFSGWIGLTAQAAMPVHLEGEPVHLTLQTNPAADSAKLVVRDDRQNVVQKIDVAVGATEATWAGVDEDGNPLPSGEYQASVESYSNGELLSSLPVEVAGKIAEARVVEGKTVLTMASGQQVLAEDIRALGNAGS